MSPKKKVVSPKSKPADPKTKRAKLKAPVEPQSASDRKAAEIVIKGLISKYALAHERLVTGVRKWLKKRLPSAHEVVYEYNGFFVISYSPTENGYDGALTLRASEEGVKLYFNFANELPDPEKRLKGSGKQARATSVVRLKELSEPALSDLIDAAIDNHPIPFSRLPGNIIIRPTTAAKKRS
ncbi:MAG: hypothetical protein U0930_00145 [Pirellulales bacterium]